MENCYELFCSNLAEVMEKQNHECNDFWILYMKVTETFLEKQTVLDLWPVKYSSNKTNINIFLHKITQCITRIVYYILSKGELTTVGTFNK